MNDFQNLLRKCKKMWSGCRWNGWDVVSGKEDGWRWYRGTHWCYCVSCSCLVSGKGKEREN